MSKKSKLIIAILIVIITVCSNLIDKRVEANNYKDKHYEFYFNASKTKTYVASSGRRKEDDSKSYITCYYAKEPYISGNLHFIAQAQGSNKKKSGYKACSYKGKNTPSYVIYKGDSKYLTNFIYETNKKYGNIHVKKNGPAATFKGYWSPDNYNKY